MNRKAAITGGSGFIGSHLVRRLVQIGWSVVAIDNMARGDARRLMDVSDEVQLVECDIRDEDKVTAAIQGCEVVMHLAAINGTENFYKHPDLVLDVGVKGILSVVSACQRASVPDLVVASTAEVYQEPSIFPTPETVALTLPDSTNPRYSYGGSKIISELIAFNYGREHFRKVQVFRPHNVYGPDMGWKHVVPQFIRRALDLEIHGEGHRKFLIQGSGNETRAFAYVSDVVDGIIKMYERGGHREIYHIGTEDEVSIKVLAEKIGRAMNLDLEITPSERAVGATTRRCPDIRKIRMLGYNPSISLERGLIETIGWYRNNIKYSNANALM